MESISFEWDEKKSKSNLTKHKVSFDEAQTVFFDSNARMIFDPDHSSSEDRFILLGMSALLRVLVVCHCCLENEGTSYQNYFGKKGKPERTKTI